MASCYLINIFGLKYLGIAFCNSYLRSIRVVYPPYVNDAKINPDVFHMIWEGIIVGIPYYMINVRKCTTIGSHKDIELLE